MSPAKRPSLRVERTLFREGHTLIAGMDEVGRGAIAGPVSVGVVVIDAGARTAPMGVRDSKLLTPAARVAMVPKIQRWALAYAVGHASSDEIDEMGIMSGLRLAGQRALAQITLGVDLVLLDGNHDWLTDPAQMGLFADLEPASTPPVQTRIKADMTCSSVAAASVLAKVERDAQMVAMHEEFPHYGWSHNKGYSAPEHAAALRAFGPCPVHRQSWRLAGVPPRSGPVAPPPPAG